MFATGASFRALSTILNLAFATANTSDYYHTSVSYLYKKYSRLLEEKEKAYQQKIRRNVSYGSLCFDHQLTRKIAGKFEGNSHRLAIVWYSDMKHNVLGMPEIPRKSGEFQTAAIVQKCQEFQIESKQVAALVSDNENVNTGVHNGSCVLIEKEFNRQLLQPRCRHHIFEIIVAKVYLHLFGSETPNNVFYSTLKERWEDLKRSNFPYTPFDEETFTEHMDSITYRDFEDQRDQSVNDLRRHSRSKNTRDDYKEVTSLALKFFGEPQNRRKANEVKFRTLINPSHARFMATIIQGIELYLFREHFDWDSQELQQFKHNLTRFTTFVSLIYVRYWNTCPILFDAPINDLRFLQELQTYRAFDSTVADIAIAAFEKHLCYMGQELAPLSLFSDKVSSQQKNIMAEKLLNNQMVARDYRYSSNHLAFSVDEDEETYDWSSKQISDFIGERSRFFFEVMDLPRDFLNVDASEWNTNLTYIRARKIIQSTLICVNDTSERVISNSKSKFNKQRCRNENTFRQNILNLHLNLFD